MTRIKLSHYAFNEGRAGYRNGCCISANPYYDKDGNATGANKEAAVQWRAGWKDAKREAEAKVGN